MSNEADVDLSRIPDFGDPTLIRTGGQILQQQAEAVQSRCQSTNTAWGTIRAPFQTPVTDLLVAATKPTVPDSNSIKDDGTKAGTALDAIATTIASLQHRAATLRTDVATLNSDISTYMADKSNADLKMPDGGTIPGTPNWHSNTGLTGRQSALQAELEAILNDWQTAQDTCVQALSTLFTSVHARPGSHVSTAAHPAFTYAGTKQADHGWGWAWNHPEEAERRAYESAGQSLKDLWNFGGDAVGAHGDQAQQRVKDGFSALGGALTAATGIGVSDKQRDEARSLLKNLASESFHVHDWMHDPSKAAGASGIDLLLLLGTDGAGAAAKGATTTARGIKTIEEGAEATRLLKTVVAANKVLDGMASKAGAARASIAATKAAETLRGLQTLATSSLPGRAITGAGKVAAAGARTISHLPPARAVASVHSAVTDAGRAVGSSATRRVLGQAASHTTADAAAAATVTAGASVGRQLSHDVSAGRTASVRSAERVGSRATAEGGARAGVPDGARATGSTRSVSEASAAAKGQRTVTETLPRHGSSSPRTEPHTVAPRTEGQATPPRTDVPTTPRSAADGGSRQPVTSRLDHQNGGRTSVTQDARGRQAVDYTHKDSPMPTTVQTRSDAVTVTTRQTFTHDGTKGVTQEVTRVHGADGSSTRDVVNRIPTRDGHVEVRDSLHTDAQGGSTRTVTRTEFDRAGQQTAPTKELSGLPPEAPKLRNPQWQPKVEVAPDGSYDVHLRDRTNVTGDLGGDTTITHADGTHTTVAHGEVHTTGQHGSGVTSTTARGPRVDTSYDNGLTTSHDGTATDYSHHGLDHTSTGGGHSDTQLAGGSRLESRPTAQGGATTVARTPHADVSVTTDRVTITHANGDVTARATASLDHGPVTTSDGHTISRAANGDVRVTTPDGATVTHDGHHVTLQDGHQQVTANARGEHLAVHTDTATGRSTVIAHDGTSYGVDANGHVDTVHQPPTPKWLQDHLDATGAQNYSETGVTHNARVEPLPADATPEMRQAHQDLQRLLADGTITVRDGHYQLTRPIDVPVDGVPNTAEAHRQMQGAADRLGQMTNGQRQANVRSANSLGQEIQNAMRRTQRASVSDLAKTLQDDLGLDRAAARRQATAIIANRHQLHLPDKVLGGDPLHTGGFENAVRHDPINSAVGRVWSDPSAVRAFQAAVDDALAGLPRSVRNDVRLHIRFVLR